MGRVLSIGGSQAFRQQVARALQSVPEDVEWVPTVTAAEETLSRNGAADVLVLAPSVREPDAFGLADSVLSSRPATALVLVRDRESNGLLPAAMRAGIRDVVDLSKGGEDFRDALERALEWSERLRSAQDEEGQRRPAHRGALVSVFSSKGGTGKTFLTCNLGAAIAAQTGRDTAVIDLDLDLGDVFSYFGEEPTHAIGDLIDMGEDADRETVLSVGTRVAEHLWVYGSPPDPSRGEEGFPSQAVGKTLRALRAAFDFTLVDASAEYSDTALAAFDLSDVVYLITGLDVVGVRHLSKALETLVSIGIPRDRFRFVLNRADSKVALAPEEVERVMNLKIDAMIPSSRLVPTSLNTGKPVFVAEPRSNVARAIAELATKLAHEVAAPETFVVGDGQKEDRQKKFRFFAHS